MSFINKIFENEINNIIKEVDELATKHIEIMDKRQKSHSVKDLTNETLDKDIEKRIIYLMTKITILKQISGALN